MAQAETTLTNAQAALVDLESQRAADEHAIAMLTGRPPADLTIKPDPAWKPTPPPTPVALPSTLLQRRPDVAAAERGAAAANAEIGVATAGYFPALDHRGRGRTATPARWISSLFKSSNNLWSIGYQRVGDRVRTASPPARRTVARGPPMTRPWRSIVRPR